MCFFLLLKLKANGGGVQSRQWNDELDNAHSNSVQDDLGQYLKVGTTN